MPWEPVAFGSTSLSLAIPLCESADPAQFWAEPETEEGFADLVQMCFDEDIPFMVMGRGSNLLVRDRRRARCRGSSFKRRVRAL